MDRITDCFVKFFLQQAEEIKPNTIQALIDHGYCTKLSLTAMDLQFDLPLIQEVPLAQRSLLRKYIGALQESQPFSVTLSNEPSSSAMNKYYPNVPIKKRKYDVYITDLQNSSWMNSVDNNNPSGSNKVPSNLFSPRSISSTNSNRSHSSPSYNFDTTSDQHEPEPKRLSSSIRINTKSSDEEDNENYQAQNQEKMDEDLEDQSQDRIIQITKTSTRGRPRKSTTSTAARTKSQILFEKMKQNLQEDQDESSTLIIENDSQQIMNTSNRGRGRGRKSTNAIRTPSQIRFEKMRKSLANNSMDVDSLSSNVTSSPPNPPSTPVTKTIHESKVLTPAERAVMEKMEQKRKVQAQSINQKNTARRRKK